MSGLLLLTLLFLLRSPPVEAASNFHLRNHTGALFLYAFDNGQVPTSPPAYVPDRLNLNLMGNLTTSTTGAVSWSTLRQGMSIQSAFGGVRAESQASSAGLLDRISSDFTIELFLLSPGNPLAQSLLIAGFGDWPPGTPYAPCDASNTLTEGGWRLASVFGSSLQFEVVISIDGIPTCRTLTIANTANVIRHLVIRANVQEGVGVVSMVSHSNSVAASNANYRFEVANWTRHAAPLTIASPHPSAGWAGTVYMIGMFDRYLSDAEIAANLNYGPPNSVPACAASALTVLEDGSLSMYP